MDHVPDRIRKATAWRITPNLVDSMDFPKLVIALHGATGIDVPEYDYARVTTLRDCESYLGERIAAKGRTP